MFSLISDYTKWHYSYALAAIISLAQEFVRFFFNLFSVKLFLKSLFSPIFSIPTNDISSTEISDLAAAFAGGFLTRIIGVLFRLLFIILGLLGGIISILVFMITFVVWVLLPVVVPVLIYLAGAVSLSML
jgi:hypothetical protein